MNKQELEIVKQWHDDFKDAQKVSLGLADKFCQKFNRFLCADIANEKIKVSMKPVSPCRCAYLFYLDELLPYCAGGAA